MPIAPPAEWVEELRGTPARAALAAARGGSQAEWALSDEELRDLVNAGALDLIEATVAAGRRRPGTPAPGGSSYLAQQANTRGVELDELPITPAQVARVIALVAGGELNNKLARQVVDGVLAGEGEPGRGGRGPRAGRGVRRHRPASPRSTRRWPPSPTWPRRSAAARWPAAGAIVGAVMKATRGQADAKRVRELVLERCR